MSAHVLEGVVRIDDLGLGGTEIYLGDTSVADWANEVIPRPTGYPYTRKVKVVVMVEDAECLKAQGEFTASEGEGGYSSVTPGSGPSVYVMDELDSGRFCDITEILEQHDGHNAAISLEPVE